MGEILQLHIGSAGAHLASSFYELISEEHGLDLQGNYIGESYLQREKINVFFQPEIAQFKYSARAMLIDLDCDSIDSLRVSHSAKLFRPSNLINLKEGTNNIWSKGFYTDSWTIMKKVTEQIRREVELCDHFQGFQVVSSISGGTGSGLGCKILEHLNQEYKNIVSTVTIFSDQPNLSNNLSPYNHLLSLPFLIDLPDQSIMINNNSLLEIFEKTLLIENASFPDFNHLVAGALNIYTGAMRFMSPVPVDFKNAVMNMTPLEKFHFLNISLAPLAAKLTPQFKTLSGVEVFHQMNQANNFLAKADFNEQSLLAIANFFRGHLGDKEAEVLANKYWDKGGEGNSMGKFKSNNAFLGHSSIPPKGVKLAGSCLVNSTCFGNDLKDIKEKFEKMFKKKTYLHWLLGEGMEENEFVEKAAKVDEMLTEYQNLNK